MKKTGNILLLLFILFAGFACRQQEREVIANKIQYDVNIKSPDPDYDWWIQNLPGPQRDNLVNMIINGALSGRFQAYDYFNQPITPGEVSMILSDTSLLRLAGKNPPYEEHDTMIIYHITYDDILRIRFLEEWTIDPATLQMNKKILGIAPVARRYDLSGTERWQPLFWVYTDDNYRKQIEKSK